MYRKVFSQPNQTSLTDFSHYRFVQDLNLAGRLRQREHEEKKNHKKMNPLNPQFKARQQSYVAAWRSRMRI